MTPFQRNMLAVGVTPWASIEACAVCASTFFLSFFFVFVLGRASSLAFRANPRGYSGLNAQSKSLPVLARLVARTVFFPFANAVQHADPDLQPPACTDVGLNWLQPGADRLPHQRCSPCV